MFNNTLPIAARTMKQLIRDRRTMVLLVIAPLIIASLIGESIPNRRMLDTTLPAMLAMLILFLGFILSGISFLRERTQGTMERLMASPVSRFDIVAGYLIGFLGFAIAQTLILFFYTVYVLKANFTGDLLQIILFQIIIGIMAVCLGIFISVFAKNEFQMVQFIPLIIMPQVFICGLLLPVSQLPEYLQWIARFLPLTYGIDGIRALMLYGKDLSDIGKEIGILLAFVMGLMILAAFSLRRGSSV